MPHKLFSCYKERPFLLNFIRRYRIAAGLTQSELAAAIGVSKNAVSSFERGQYYPSARHAALLCDVLDVSFEELFFLA